MSPASLGPGATATAGGDAKHATRRTRRRRRPLPGDFFEGSEIHELDKGRLMR